MLCFVWSHFGGSPALRLKSRHHVFDISQLLYCRVAYVRFAINLYTFDIGRIRTYRAGVGGSSRRTAGWPSPFWHRRAMVRSGVIRSSGVKAVSWQAELRKVKKWHPIGSEPRFRPTAQWQTRLRSSDRRSRKWQVVRSGCNAHRFP